MEPHAAHRQHYGLTLAVLSTAALAYALLQTMVAPALPEIERELHTSTTAVTWVMTVYLLTASVLTPILGRLGDMYGKERLLVIVMGIFGLGTVLCGLAHALPLLIAGRAVQGAGGAVFPLAFGIIRDEFPPGKVAGGIGLISATFGIGGGAGLVLAGVIVEHFSWEWIFWFSLLLTVPALVAIHLFVPESPIKTPARIHWTGGALLSLGLVLLLLGVSEAPSWGWGDDRVLGLMAAGLIVLILWVAAEQRAAEPLVDMRMMRLRGVWTTNVVALLMGFGMFGSFILVPQFVQAPARAGYGFHASVIESGLFLLPSALVMLVGGPAAGWLGTRFGSKLPLLLGCAFGALGFGFIAAEHGAAWEIYAGTSLFGLGIAFAYASMANLVVEAVPQHQTGVATGINTITRSVGGAFGAQLSATIVAATVLTRTGLPSEAGFTLAFAASSGALVVGFLAGLLVPGRPRLAAERVGEPLAAGAER
jgi:EmrB/QacA subfamily drug resistance transporter